MNNNQMDVFLILAETNDYSRLEYVGLRVGVNEDDAIKEFVDKDRLTAIPIREVAGYIVKLFEKDDPRLKNLLTANYTSEKQTNNEENVGV